MLRALCLPAVVLVLPLGYAQAGAPPELGANAALKYWQAFATLPRFTEAEQKKLNTEYLTRPLDAQARQTLARARYALDMMQRGAALPRCDWGIGYEEGVGVLFPDARAARMLCSLACLRARLRVEEGSPAAPLGAVVARM